MASIPTRTYPIEAVGRRIVDPPQKRYIGCLTLLRHVVNFRYNPKNLAFDFQMATVDAARPYILP